MDLTKEEKDACKVCSAPIEWGELCEECSKDNDPFFVCDNCGKDLR